jgi:hypothetical protein
MPQDIAETGPSAGKKKSKASSKPKALASKEATLDDVAPTSDTGQAPAAEHDTPSAAPTQQSPQDDPTPEASKSKATSRAKKPAVKASSPESAKGRSGKPKHNVTNEPALSSQAATQGSVDPSEEQKTQAAAPKPKRRAKLGLFGDAEAKSDQTSDGSAAEGADSPSATQQPASDEPSTKAPVKRKSSKRMARAADTSSDAQKTEPHEG